MASDTTVKRGIRSGTINDVTTVLKKHPTNDMSTVKLSTPPVPPLKSCQILNSMPLDFSGGTGGVTVIGTNDKLGSRRVIGWVFFKHCGHIIYSTTPDTTFKAFCRSPMLLRCPLKPSSRLISIMFNHLNPTKLDYPFKITSKLGIIRSPICSIYLTLKWTF